MKFSPDRDADSNKTDIYLTIAHLKVKTLQAHFNGGFLNIFEVFWCEAGFSSWCVRTIIWFFLYLIELINFGILWKKLAIYSIWEPFFVSGNTVQFGQKTINKFLMKTWESSEKSWVPEWLDSRISTKNRISSWIVLQNGRLLFVIKLKIKNYE